MSDTLTSMDDAALTTLYERLNDELRQDLTALNAKQALREQVRRELHGRLRKPVDAPPS